MTVVQNAGLFYRPQYEQSSAYNLILSDLTVATASAPRYSGTKAPIRLQAVLATPIVYYTDHLEPSSTASRYRTIRIVYMLLDEDHRPNVALTSTRLRLDGHGFNAIESPCGTSLSTNRFHSCALVLDQSILPQRKGMLARAHCRQHIVHSADHAKPAAIMGSRLLRWLVYSACASNSNILYARGPSGPVISQSGLDVVRLQHTANVGVNFRFHSDPEIVAYVGINGWKPIRGTAA